MSLVGFAGTTATETQTREHRCRLLTPRRARIAMAAILIGAVGVSFAGVGAAETSRAVAGAGDDLTRLLRFMALIKGVFALAAVGVLSWRLGSEVSWPRFAAYAAVGAVMVAGPGLIWSMAHVGLGALFLHGGLVAMIVLLWRDPAIPARLEATLLRRRPSSRRFDVA